MMLALTLWQPWAWAHKRVENRPWAPPRTVWGDTIAIHAGMTFDKAGFEFIRQRAVAEGWKIEVGELFCTRGAVLAVARIVGHATVQEVENGQFSLGEQRPDVEAAVREQIGGAL